MMAYLIFCSMTSGNYSSGGWTCLPPQVVPAEYCVRIGATMKSLVWQGRFKCLNIPKGDRR